MTVWDSEALWLKAKWFVDKANEFDQGSPDFSFWTALSLECLARSALTNIHPALNADPREPENLLYAFGYELTATPRSLPAHAVFLRLERTVKDFGKLQRELCDFVALNRNAQIHTGALPYENLSPAKWLPRYYETVQILCEFLEKKLTDFLGTEVAKSALELIKALNEQVLGVVKSTIAAHAKVFFEKSAEEQQALKQAADLATLELGLGQVVRSCPSCDAEEL